MMKLSAVKFVRLFLADLKTSVFFIVLCVSFLTLVLMFLKGLFVKYVSILHSVNLESRCFNGFNG